MMMVWIINTHQTAFLTGIIACSALSLRISHAILGDVRSGENDEISIMERQWPAGLRQ